MKIVVYLIGILFICVVAHNEAEKSEKQLAPKPLPRRIVGLYLAMADDSEEGFESDSDSWMPELYEWQQKAANVLFFSFIQPETMEVPPSFQKLAASRGTNSPGAVPANAIIIFAIGGYDYSLHINPWDWLTSKEKAEAMAEKVATWPELYGCDGIDLDIETGAGDRDEAGPHMVDFIKKLKQLSPNIIISQPTFGYPDVKEEIYVINQSWDDQGNSHNIAETIGLMVYEGDQALSYVKNYVDGPGQWEGFPITARAPYNTIILGSRGSNDAGAISKLAEETVKQNLRGIMVWYSSVKNGFQYAPWWDANGITESENAYIAAMEYFNANM